MSFKGAADKVSYLHRAANHSTKPFKRGTNEHLASQTYDITYPLQIAEREAIEAHELRTRNLQLTAKLNAISVRLKELNDQLSETLPFDRYVRVSKERKEIGNEIQLLASEKSDIKRRLKELGEYTDPMREVIFMDLARQVLPDNVFKDLCRATNDVYAVLTKAGQS